MAKLEVSQLRKHWTDCHKIWHGWLCRRYDSSCQNSNQSPLSRQTGEIFHSRGFYFFKVSIVTQIFACDPRFQGCLIHRTSIQGCCDHTMITAKSFRFPPSPSTPKGAWIGIFKPNSRNILHDRFRPNFAQYKDHELRFVGGQNRRTTNPRWRLPPLWKIEKLSYLRNGLTYLAHISPPNRTGS